ncbi:MAG: peptidoglycan-binding domain-containing protein [Maritimibacter sp.]|jgi:hypothetical protein
MTRTINLSIATLALLAGLSGCATAPAPAPLAEEGGDEAVITDFTLGPPGARPGACYGKDVTPAVLELVTEQVVVTPATYAEDGSMLAPKVYGERSFHREVTPRKVIYFETPCPPRWTPDFISSVQRALQVRGIYLGAINGRLNQATRQAIRAYQMRGGLNSGILSIESARALGLVEVAINP